MPEIVTLLDDTVGPPVGRRRRMVRRLELVASTTTVRELIVERVRRDFAEKGPRPRDLSNGPYGTTRQEIFSYDPDDSAVVPALTDDEAVEQALAAVRRGEVLFFWNDRHIDDLDLKLDLMGENEAVFLRLFPMKGG